MHDLPYLTLEEIVLKLKKKGKHAHQYDLCTVKKNENIKQERNL